MQDNKADYTNTFLYISENKNVSNTQVYNDERFTAWQNIWKQRVSMQE
jgi:hypothetical protein